MIYLKKKVIGVARQSAQDSQTTNDEVDMNFDSQSLIEADLFARLHSGSTASRNLVD